MPSQIIPNGWIRAKISDISTKGLQRKPEADERFTYVDIGSIDRNLKQISGPQVIFGAEAPSRARKVIDNGDVLVSLTRPNLNAVALVGQEYDQQIASTGFEVIKPVLVDSRYIFVLVRSEEFVDEISGAVQGALYPAAKSSDVQNFEFPLPPLAEQKVIADKLDTLLAQVENTKARLERIPQILKRFRQSVLAAAVNGRLTEEWRSERSLKKPSIIPNKRLAKIESNDYYGESVDLWEWCRLGSLADLSNGDRGKNYPNKSEYVEQGIPFINTGHINADGTLSNERMNFITEQKYNSLGGGKTQPSDLVYCLRGATMGKTARVEYEVGAIASSLVIVRPKEALIRDFAYYFLTSPQAKELISLYDNGSAQPNLSAKSLASFPLQIPSREEQIEIVRRVDQLFAHADRIEQQVNTALSRVNNLTQSMLAKAFRGELTEQWRRENPELISGENSAEALLERIKAERVGMKPANKTRKRTPA